MLEQGPPTVNPAHLLTAFSIERARQARGISVPAHSHAEGMLVLVQTGLALVQGNTEMLTTAPGNIGWVPPGIMHEAHWFGHARGTFLYVRADACARLPEHTSAWPLRPLVDALIDRLAGPAGAALSPAYGERLLDILLTELGLCEQSAHTLPMPRERRLRELAVRLLASPDDGSSIETWAERLNMSARTLMRRFRGETGITLGQWRQKVRLLRALELLAGGKPVTDVALAVGYDSPSAFIGSFRATYGVTPSQYFARNA
ncbi:AraC family transcriptional regulator [Bordetella bronchiseptica]|uniref:AraC family transcriptional regulator n=1 Tax=Bordetella bronchiseptica TaxID=518 RepID=UPI0013F610E8|nr:AraC family transcriptional regulator [Bordetella bronchiseptica]